MTKAAKARRRAVERRELQRLRNLEHTMKFGGTELQRMQVIDSTQLRLEVAQKLGYTITLRPSNSGRSNEWRVVVMK